MGKRCFGHCRRGRVAPRGARAHSNSLQIARPSRGSNALRAVLGRCADPDCFRRGRAALLAFLLASLGPAWAAAQSGEGRAGGWLFRAGFNEWAPSVRSGELGVPNTPGARVNLRPNSQVFVGLTYLLNESWAVDVPLTLPFSNELEGAGATKDVGVLATVQTQPLSVLLRHRWAPMYGVFRPYVAAGPSYVRMEGAQPTKALTALGLAGSGQAPTVRAESKWAPTFGAGLTYDYNQQIFFELSVMKTLVSTRLSFSGGQRVDVDVDPMVFSTSVGWRF